MLDIVLFVLTSPHADLPISPSTNQVRSVAMSNIDGFTPNHLLQQMYGIKVVDEVVDVELNDEELELIAGGSIVAKSYSSDVFVGNTKIISLNDVLRLQNDHQGLIDYINRRFTDSRIPIAYQAARELSQHLRAVAPRVIKGERGGFKINLNTAQVCYNDTPCPF